MRRAIARGRILPQSLSTDPRYGRLSLKAQVLYPLLWVNADDQGRLSGDPDEIKYAACPSIREISAEEIPDLLQQMETKGMIQVYATSKTKAIQMLDWWEVQRLQWAYPSGYPAAEGWTDHLRYHPTPTEIITENWPPSSQLAFELLPSKLPSALPSNPEVSLLPTKRESSKEKDLEEEGGNRRGRGRGILPSKLGSKPSPSPAVLSTDNLEILHRLTSRFKKEWGRVPAEAPDTVIPREPNARESAQLRDLAKELSAAGGCPLDHIDQAFREAAGQVKFHISYVRAILLDWLGVARGPPA